MNTNNKSILAILPMIGFFLISCGNYLENKTNNNDTQQVPNDTQKDPLENQKLDFEFVKAQVFQPRCIVCHDDFDSYATVITEINDIKDEVSTNSMPKAGGPLSENQKKILFRWIENGAPEKVISN